jgi:hypothetical protein
MNWKLVVVGGIVFYVVTFIVGMATGPLIHNGVLKDDYKAHSSFWRPELQQDPPDMAALMPLWVTTGLLTSLVLAGIYGAVRSAFAGAPWMKGLKYGVVLSLFGICWAAGYSGVFNLPNTIWAWWAGEGFLYYLPGGAALGWVGGKLAP